MILALIVGIFLGAGTATMVHNNEPDRIFMRDGKVYQVTEVLEKEQIKTKVTLQDQQQNLLGDVLGCEYRSNMRRLLQCLPQNS